MLVFTMYCVCICSDTRESIGTTIKTISKLQWGQFPQINGYDQTFRFRYQLQQHLLPRQDEHGAVYSIPHAYLSKMGFNPNFCYCAKILTIFREITAKCSAKLNFTNFT